MTLTMHQASEQVKKLWRNSYVFIHDGQACLQVPINQHESIRYVGNNFDECIEAALIEVPPDIPIGDA